MFSSSTPSPTPTDPEHSSPTFIGVLMAIIGSSLIGISYTASKFAHNKVRLQGIESRQHRQQRQQRIPLTPTRRTNNHVSLTADASTETANPECDDVKSTDSCATIGIAVDDDEEEEDESKSAVAQQLHHHQYSMTSTMRLKEWWLSIIFLLAGESFNFLAYGFAPTSLIAPLGTLSIISGALSGYLYLGESIQRRNVMGMLLSIAGAVVIVFSSRDEEPQLTPEDIVAALCQLQFLIYGGVSVVLTVALLILDTAEMPDRLCLLRFSAGGPTDGRLITKYGDRFVVVRVMLTALFSGYTVLCTKSVASLISLTFVKMFNYWISWLLLFMLLVNALMAVYYTNKALAGFDSTQVLPAEFAAFTFCAVLGSAMMYNDFDTANGWQIALFIVGCSLTFLGVYFITSDSEKFGKSISERASIALLTTGIPSSFGTVSTAAATRYLRPKSSLSPHYESATGSLVKQPLLSSPDTPSRSSQRHTIHHHPDDRILQQILPTTTDSWRTDRYWNRRYENQVKPIETTTTTTTIARNDIESEQQSKPLISSSASSFHTSYETFAHQPPPDESSTSLQHLPKALIDDLMKSLDRRRINTAAVEDMLKRLSYNGMLGLGNLLDTVGSSSRASLTFQQVVLPRQTNISPDDSEYNNEGGARSMPASPKKSDTDTARQDDFTQTNTDNSGEIVISIEDASKYSNSSDDHDKFESVKLTEKEIRLKRQHLAKLLVESIKAKFHKK